MNEKIKIETLFRIKIPHFIIVPKKVINQFVKAKNIIKITSVNRAQKKEIIKQ